MDRTLGSLSKLCQFFSNERPPAAYNSTTQTATVICFIKISAAGSLDFAAVKQSTSCNRVETCISTGDSRPAKFFDGSAKFRS